MSFRSIFSRLRRKHGTVVPTTAWEDFCNREYKKACCDSKNKDCDNTTTCLNTPSEIRTPDYQKYLIQNCKKPLSIDASYLLKSSPSGGKKHRKRHTTKKAKRSNKRHRKTTNKRK